MPKDLRKWLKPGSLAAKVSYEKQRENTIRKNKQRLDALGLKQVATSLNGSGNSISTIKKGKKPVDRASDDEYTPSNNGDDDDDESYNSLEPEVS